MMKKLILIILGFLTCITAFGQVKCVSSNVDFEMSYKRTIVSNNAVIVDFLITYYGNGSREFSIEEGNTTIVYDDEGNIYRGYTTAGNTPTNIFANIGNSGSNKVVLQSEVPVKVRLTIKDVDEYATLFPKMELSCYFGDGKGWHPITISNVPIPRD